jgi:hypothetical protein
VTKKKTPEPLPELMPAAHIWMDDEWQFVESEFHMMDIIRYKLGDDVGDYLREWYERIVNSPEFCSSEADRLAHERYLKRLGSASG